MVKIIRSRHFSREGAIDVMEIPFEPLPNLAALVFVHGDELHGITNTYPQSVEPDLPEALLDMIQRGYAVKAEKLWDRVHRAKGIILAFDNNGNLVGCTAIRRDQRPYREKIRNTFGISVDAAYALSWVRARDEFKVREFYELIITTALAILDQDHVVYVTATGNESRPAYIEALGSTGFTIKESRPETPLAHLRLFVLQGETPEAVAVPEVAVTASRQDFDGEDACEESPASDILGGVAQESFAADASLDQGSDAMQDDSREEILPEEESW